MTILAFVAGVAVGALAITAVVTWYVGNTIGNWFGWQ